MQEPLGDEASHGMRPWKHRGQVVTQGCAVGQTGEQSGGRVDACGHGTSWGELRAAGTQSRVQEPPPAQGHQRGGRWKGEATVGVFPGVST